MPTADIVYNPISGRVRAEPLVARAAELLRSFGWEISVSPSRSSQEVTELARRAGELGRDVFFIAGGDGTIIRAVEGLLGSRTALGALPAGTANVWARQIGLPGWSWLNPKAVKQAALLLSHGKVHTMDVGFCGESPFLLWAGLGLDGWMVQKMEGRREGPRRFSVLKYILETFKDARKWEGIALDLDIDGHTTSGRYTLAVVSNIERYAGGYFNLSPQACLDDGEMDLWLFPGSRSADTIKLILRGLTGTYKNSKDSQRLPVRSLKIKAGRPFAIQIDGDPITAGGDLNIRVEKHALRVLVPQSTPESLFRQPPIIPMMNTENK